MTDTADRALAPWGEIVPRDGLMTVDELLALPDDGLMYELVEGRLVRMAPSGIGASAIGTRLGARLAIFVEDHGLGIVTVADGTYDLGAGTALAPDVAFVRAERMLAPDSPLFDKAWPLAPDLAVEVASPNQYRPEMRAKALRYLAAGTRMVWVVWPKYKQVHVWRSAGEQPSATWGIGDVLDGLDVIPGFSFPVARLFTWMQSR